MGVFEYGDLQKCVWALLHQCMCCYMVSMLIQCPPFFQEMMQRSYSLFDGCLVLLYPHMTRLLQRWVIKFLLMTTPLLNVDVAYGNKYDRMFGRHYRLCSSSTRFTSSRHQKCFSAAFSILILPVSIFSATRSCNDLTINS